MTAELTLNEQVAIILGWERTDRSDYPWRSPGRGAFHPEVPRFDREWMAAGEVLEWLADQGCYVSVGWDRYLRHWWAEITDERDWTYPSQKAATAPVAIAAAVVAAFGGGA